MNNTKKSNNASDKGACPLAKTVGVTLFLSLFSCTHGNVFASADTLQNKLILTNDSGFVTKKEGVAFLLANSIIDTNNFLYVTDNDTIGKYYRIDSSNRYIMCLLGCPEHFYPFANRIIEITSNGELVKNEIFAFPCSNIPYNKIFSRYGDFFGIRTCYIYVGAFRSDLFLFKEITPQDSITPILFSYWHHQGRIFYKKSISNIEVKGNELIIHYLTKIDITKKQPFDKNGNLRYKTPRTKKFTREYFLEDKQWVSKDIEKDKKTNEKINKWWKRIVKNIREI